MIVANSLARLLAAFALLVVGKPFVGNQIAIVAAARQVPAGQRYSMPHPTRPVASRRRRPSEYRIRPGQATC